MQIKDHIAHTTGILLAIVAVLSLAAWAVEEATALIPQLDRLILAAAAVSLALDACVLGIGLALLFPAANLSGARRIFPLVEIASSLPVIILSSAPVLYSHLEGTRALLPALFLAARSLRILRLYRVLPGSSPSVLAVLTLCEIFRSLAGILLPDASRLSASLRLLLVPEAMLVLGAAMLSSAALMRRRDARGAEPPREAPVGEEELAGLLGKRESW